MKPSSSESRPGVLVQERRTEPRHDAQGQVMVTDEATGVCMIGELIDTSDSGFRASFNLPAPTSGTTYRFEHPFASGKARVVWSRIIEGAAEAGFFIRP